VTEANIPSIYDFSATSLDEHKVSLADYKGKVLVIVNTASKCGFTPQYAGLEALYRQYKDRGVAVLGFPCNQFGSQEPGTDAEIAQFCELNFGVSFPLFAKVDVNGAHAHPLFQYLKWNFTKFLVDREGKVVARYAPSTTPHNLASAVEKLL
jgi:glutathione peroxidase